MSLFSAQSEINLRIIDPSQVEIEGEINGSFFAGRIEMKFINQNLKLDNFKLLIGKKENSKICLHDFQVKIDENPFVLKLREVNEAKEIFAQKVRNNEPAVFGVGDVSYASIDIPNILPNQLVTISANFELPATYISENNIGIFFPITYPGTKYDEVMKCSNFKFSLNFQSLQLNENSISSNPDGTIDLSKFTYFIDKLEPSITSISIMIDLNQSFFSEQFSQTSNSNSQIATCCGKYGSLMFIPTKDGEGESNDHSGEEFIFIVDCSSSMRGKKIELASQCLTFFIKSLPENCYFNVIRFGSQFIPLFNNPVPYTEENASPALHLARNLRSEFIGTVLTDPLNYVFSKNLSEKNKLRRVFVLTDGWVENRREVISIVERNSNTTMCSAIGIGYGADRKLVKGIGRAGKGFFDFVLSGDDMRSKVINQLSQSLNGLCKVDISIENDETVEILPPLSFHQFSPGIPATVYFKSSEEFKDNTHIIIDVEGNSEQKIVQMKTLPSNSRACRSLEYLFNNENIKYLRNLRQTDEVKSKITQLSIRYGILTQCTGLIGTQEHKADEEKERKKSLIKYEHQNNYNILFKTLKGEQKTLLRRSQDDITSRENLVLTGLMSTSVVNSSKSKSNSINSSTKKPQRNFVYIETNDLLSIVSEQMVNGCWKNIPKILQCKKFQNIIENIQKWCLNKTFDCGEDIIIGTMASLTYMFRCKKECFHMWSLIYRKGIKYLKTINPDINWEDIIRNESNISQISNDLQSIPLKKASIKDLIYELNVEERTAKLIRNKRNDEDVYIPTSILYSNKEYIITCISSGAFKGSNTIKSVQFPLDSEVRIIEKNAFVDSSIEKLFIPSKMSVLEEGWCNGTSRLTNVGVMPNNRYFMYLNNKMIIGKKNNDSNETYDTVHFVRRDIKKVEIPSFIERIESFSFSTTEIEKITIPSKVKYIGKCAFSSCKKLQHVEIEHDSKLQYIEQDAFENTSIQNIPVPSCLTQNY